MSGEAVVSKSNNGKYFILRFPESDHYSCDGEWLTTDEVADLIAKLQEALRGKQDSCRWSWVP